MQPERLTVEALVRLPHQLVMVVGLAWLPDGAEVAMDDEHDDYAWWPADVADWPARGRRAAAADGDAARAHAMTAC